MKIYTRTGDDATTGTFGGGRRVKHDPRIEAYGTLDELNATLGHLRDATLDEHTSRFLLHIQSEIFTLGSHLATPGGSEHLPELPNELVTDLEREIDRLETHLPPLRNFILPGGHPLVSWCHSARTDCRRAERRVSELHAAEPLDPFILQILNRLSDYFFVLGRWTAQEVGVQEVVWKPRD